MAMVERLGVGVGLSIALVPLGLFLLDTLLDVAVDRESALVLALSLAFAGTAAAFGRRWLAR